MRFKMRFEGEEVPERRFSGTIVGVGENESFGWSDSEWRSLKVQWDEPSTILRPDRVSPWELEPLVAVMPPSSEPAHRNKRSRPPVSFSPAPDSAMGTWKSQVDSPSVIARCDAQNGLESYASAMFSTAAKTSSLGFTGMGSVGTVTSNSMYWSNQVKSVTDSFISTVSKEAVEKRQGTGNGCRLFGIQLVENSNVDENEQVIMPSGVVGDERPIPPGDMNFDLSPLELQTKQTRSCTKVHMQGTAVGRAVDLTRFDRYEDLAKLEEMFDIRGELCGSSKKWQVAPYCASKWAVEGLTRAVAKELPPRMEIVALSPGVINTDMLASCFGSSASLYQKPEDWAPKAANMILNFTEADNGASLSV